MYIHTHIYICEHMVGRIMGPQRCALPRGFADVIKVMNLKMGDYPGLSKWIQSKYVNS